MIDRDEGERGLDLASLAVPRAGSLVETGDVWEPYRLLDPTGQVVEPVGVYFRELQAIGRSVATQRSYGMDLLRWFRFLWAVDEVPWHHATRAEARDFSRWIQVTDKPRRAGARVASGAPNAVTGKPGPGRGYASRASAGSVGSSPPALASGEVSVSCGGASNAAGGSPAGACAVVTRLRSG